MSIGSLSSTTVPASAFASADASAQAAKAVQARETSTIADHVAAADEHEPIRSVSTNQGTLVDTYL